MKSSNSNLIRQPEELGKKLTCFIAASSRANLNTIKALLEKMGISILVPSEFSADSVSIHEHVTQAISKADFLIAILDPKESNSNIYYELGYASALGKRILVLASPKLEIIPADITEMLYIRANEDNKDAIGFALDQLTKTPKLIKRRSSQPISKSQPIGHIADELLARVESLGERANERDIMDILVSALNASHITNAVHASPKEMGADISIWDDELGPWVGNPFIIEIKRRLVNQSQIRSAVNQVSSYLQKSNTQWALVLYVQGPPSVSHFPRMSTNTVLFLSILDLLRRLRTTSFSEIIRDLRNRRVHEVD